mmetsp:Transcript_130305/g.259917  ORF Transcript_130305/g.259917 Transcript_130305/m.259917 type:complete len:276 (+) Transcript_130305:63-890(+)|eukprot:CAMPEP_0172668690 /NCGR_PEP_ID=MMETSP1074-20121228/9217_1 /TAXON_ID=2916 /ORGANISM="Ceratium fusus, Strain PA161109" /LENGTH=275 /DNA_ID=CAMNT_0013485363 /DNA_START=57 /DNA_END=884 /DNA_ORIENTATION=+
MTIPIPERENLDLCDGTSITLSRPPGTSSEEWKETKRYLEGNPEEARRMETFSKDAKAMRTYMLQQAIQEYYQAKLCNGDEAVIESLTKLATDPEFVHIFDDVKREGTEAALQHSYNEPLMMKVSRAVGGIPEETRDILARITSSPLTIQEACKMGNYTAVEEYLNVAEGGTLTDLEAKDSRGVTCLGYAIGANRTAVVQLLLKHGADPWCCDSSGGTGLHYAAAYGRRELLEFLIDGGGDINAKNTQGQTPLAIATKNKQREIIQLLKSRGGEI